jgi:hypothetical protein
MTLRQFTKLVDDLAEGHGLSYQLTAAWLRNHGIDKLKLPHVTLVPAQVDDLIRWARV